MELKQILSELSNSHGVSSYEKETQQVLQNYLKDMGDVSIDHNGNLICKVIHNPKATRKVALDAHLDEIGFIVTSITKEGFLKLAPVGGVDKRLLLSSQLVVISETGPIKGIVSCFAPHLQSKDGGSEVKDIEDMFLDIGYCEQEAKKLIKKGDLVCFDTEFTSLLNNRVTGKSLDNRAGCVAILYAGKLAKEADIKDLDLTLIFSTKEEVNGAGAKTAAFGFDFTCAVVVDVSFGRAPGVAPEKSGELGKGPMIGFAPVLDRSLSKRFLQLGKEADIPCQVEIMNGKTGTNADAYFLNKEGVRTAIVSIPLRYMHSQIEVIDMDDIETTGRLIAEFLKRGE